MVEKAQETVEEDPIALARRMTQRAHRLAVEARKRLEEEDEEDPWARELGFDAPPYNPPGHEEDS